MKKRSLKKNAALNIVKQVCSILFPMITFPYASRVLGKYNYGKINFGLSIISYITLIAGLGISNYAIREGSQIRNNRRKLQKFCNEVFSINVFSTVIAYLILFILIFSWKKLNGYGMLLLIQSMTVIFTTIGADWINSIYEDYFYITIRYIICQSIAVLLMLALVRTTDDYLMYALASVSSSVVANILNIFYIRKKYKIFLKFTLHLHLKAHLKPILILFGTLVASLIYINSDITILGIIKDENEVGLYSVSSKIYTLVKQVLNAMLVVAIPRISSEIATESKNTVNKQLSEILSDLLIIVFPACVGLFALSKNIVLLFSGNEYMGATSSLEILSIGLIFATVACFFINVVMIPYRMEKKVLIATLISAITNIVLNFILIPKWGQNAAALTTLLAEFIMMFMGIYYTYHTVKLKFKKSLWIGSLNGFLTFIICFLVDKMRLSNVLSIICSFLLCVFACAVVVFISDREKFNSLVGGIITIIKH